MTRPSPTLGRFVTGRRSNSAAWVAAALLAASTILSFAPAPAAAASMGGPVAPASAGSALSEASSSLATGAGPARGAPLACSPATGGSFSCRPVLAAGPAAPVRVWSDLTSVVGTAPPNRYIGMMAYDPIDQYVVMFGGDNETMSSAYSDTWLFANGSWTEASSTSNPGPRYAAGMVWDAEDGYILLYGGHQYPTSYAYNDTWTFLHGQWTQLHPAKSPVGRWRFAMAYDGSDKEVVVFGGTAANATVPMSDTWTYVGGVWTNVTKNVTGSPTGRFRQDMVWDQKDGYLVMFGGCTAVTCPDQSTYTFSANAWTLLSPTNKPAARAYVGLVYDTQLEAVILFGGVETTGLNVGVSDTWEYTNGTWTQLNGVGTAPSARAYVMMAYDGAGNYSVLFGGANPANQIDQFADTWALGPNVLARLTASPAASDLGQRVLLNATPLAAHGSVTFTYTDLPAGCTSQNFSEIYCAASTMGTFPVTVSDNSTAGGVSNASATFSVGADPAITSFTANRTVVTAGSSVALTVVASGGQTPYRYGYAGLPPGCANSNSATPVCTPTSAGNYSVNVTLTDAANFQVWSLVSLTVNARPAVSRVTATPAVLDVGQSTTFQVTASGGTAPLSYSYTDLPNGCLTANAASLGCTPSGQGLFNVLATVSDSDGWASTNNASVTVNADPAISGFTVLPATIDVGQAVHFWLNASLGSGLLSYAYAGMPAGCNLGVSSQGACVPTASGSFSVTGTVTDGVGFAVHETITLTVNEDPAISAFAPAPPAIDAGQSTHLIVTSSGGTAPFTFAYTGLPVGCAPSTGPEVNCTGHSPAISSISVTLTDAEKQTATLGTALTVYARPAISSFNASDASVDVGASTTFLVVVTGGAGGNSYVYTQLPTGCTSQNSSSLVCSPSGTGNFDVLVNVTDALGASATADFNVSVQSAPSSGGGALGDSFLLVGFGILVVVVLLVVVAVWLLRRKKPAPAAEQPPAAWQE